MTFFKSFTPKSYHLQLHSGQIVLFLFKSHHFRTYFPCKISYNNLSRPPRFPWDIHESQPKIWGSPNERQDATETDLGLLESESRSDEEPELSNVVMHTKTVIISLGLNNFV